MSNEIKRAAELWLCAKLGALVKGVAWYPSKGGNEMADAAPVEPPFGFVMVMEAAKELPTAPVWLLSVKIAYMSHIGDTTSAAHSATVRAIEKAIPCLPTATTRSMESPCMAPTCKARTSSPTKPRRPTGMFSPS